MERIYSYDEVGAYHTGANIIDLLFGDSNSGGGRSGAVASFLFSFLS